MNFRSTNKSRRALRRLGVECLEPRQLLAGLPFGAMPDDTGEYLLGDVVVTVVLMESTPALAPHDQSTETWTVTDIQGVKDKVGAALTWWKSLLQQEAPAMASQLNFFVDYTYADRPVPTGYEPISRISNDYTFWVADFLKQVGFNQSADINTNIRAFNNSQRLAGTAAHPGPADWAYTIFVPNSTLDSDDAFAAGGSFPRAFSFAGGRMAIIPSGRPASTYAHESAHMFWALDEYSGNSAIAQRGYYDVPNSNAPHADYTQQPSIMTSGTLLQTAWETQIQAAATLEMIGWRDSDGDGLFDVVDVPFDLSGVGSYDAVHGRYHFHGQSAVRALPNRNSAGLQNDITIARITRAEYRIDGGPWQTAATFDATAVNLDLDFPVPANATLVEIRTIDTNLGAGTAGSGANSPSFQGSLLHADAVPQPGINGFVWNDADTDGTFDANEPGFSGWQVQLVDALGHVLALRQTYDPDSYAAGTILNSANPAVSLSALGGGSDGSVLAVNSSLASTGGEVFGTFDANTWNETTRRLRARFTTPVSRVSIDAIGDSNNDYARLEAYDANDQLLERVTSGPLVGGQVETLTIKRPTTEIAYVFAKGHAGSDLLLDHLQYGPDTTTVTGTGGSYLLDALPAGTYTVHVVPPGSFTATGPLPSNRIVVLAAGATNTHLDFAAQGFANPWQNPLEPFDVNNDGFVSPIDALLVINDLNLDGSRALPEGGTGTAPPPFLDVNDDGFVAPVDALLVINQLNAGAGGEAAGGAGARGGSGGATGEDLANAAGLAASAARVDTTGGALRRFTARGRMAAASVSTVDVSDELAVDVYRAWVISRDTQVDAEELSGHLHPDDSTDEFESLDFDQAVA